LQEIHKLAMLCLWEHCHHEAWRIQSSAIFIQTQITLFLRWFKTSR
jgi:hypothetical protein